MKEATSLIRKECSLMAEAMHEVKFAGTMDTLAMLSVGAAFIGSAPGLVEVPVIFPAAAAAAGAAWIGKRVSEASKKRFMFDSALSIQSGKIPDAKPGDGGFMFGYTTDDGVPMVVPDEFMTRHGIIVGQSGVGKTVAGSLLMLQHIRRGGGVLFIDGKIDQDNLEQIYRFARWSGRPHDVLVINPGDPEKSNTYNPILYGSPDEIAARLLALIPSTENNPGADYYKQAANQGITTLVSAVQRLGLAFNFIDMAILIQNQKAMERLERLMVEQCPQADETRSLTLFVEQFRSPGRDGAPAQIDVKRLKEVFGGIGGRMFTFGTGGFGKVLNDYAPEVNLEDAILSNRIIYVALPTMGKKVAATNFGKMIMGDLRSAVANIQALPPKERPNPPFMVFADEFGSYANSEDKIMFEQARSARVFMLPAIQTLANLKAVSDEFSEMILGNTWTKVFFKIGTQKTAEEIADLIGMGKSAAKTVSESAGVSASKGTMKITPESTAGESGGVSVTEKEDEDYRVSPDDLKALGMGECVVTYGGDTIYHLRVPKIDVSKDEAKKLGRFELNHYRKKYPKGLDFFKNADQYVSRK